MENLKEKTAKGMSWAFIENIMGTGITAVISIILANLLSPREFGLVGMVALFVTLSNSIMDSGFSGALIRKKDATQGDFCTVFYTNILLSLIIYAILYYTAPTIALFLNEQALTTIIRIMGLSVIILALSQVQRVFFIRRLDFKKQAVIALIASLVSGVTSIYMAIKGYGVWSLIAQPVSKQIATTLLFWLFSSWRPSLSFSVKSFTEMFGFGSKLLISSIINSIWSEIYAFAMGKLYTPAIVGLYSRADKFKAIVTSNIGIATQRVGYPVLSKVSNELERQRRVYRKMVRSTILIISTLVAGLIACAPAMVETLIGSQWLPCVKYLRIISLSGIFLPLMLTITNIFNANGKSGRTLFLEVIKTSFAALPIASGAIWGIEAMLWCIVATTAAAYLIHLYYIEKELEYSILEQIKDIIPFVILSFIMGCAVFAVELLAAKFALRAIVTLILQVGTGFILTMVLYQTLYRCEEYKEMKAFIFSSLLSAIAKVKKVHPEEEK